MHAAIMIIWLVHQTGTMSFSIDVLRHFPPALSYFLKDKYQRNTVSWSAAKSGQIPEFIFYWAFLIRFLESFGIILHFCSTRKMLNEPQTCTCNIFEGELHLKAKLTMFCAHFQNFQLLLLQIWMTFLNFSDNLLQDICIIFQNSVL